LPEEFHAEFTGERAIPGRVDVNLFNEHFARYRFAAQLAKSSGLSGAFLDAGCGAGYGAVELAKTGARVMGIDVSEEAVGQANANYAPNGNIHFERASCTAIPAADDSFQLIAAFEVIEHISEWRDFLREARRVLDRAGVFLVSTPNRLYYAESRKKAGPNPFHVHEFAEEEFRAELESIFPHVKMLAQNHVEGIAFGGLDTEGAGLEISARPPGLSAAHFFLAVCGKQSLPPIASFLYIPDSGNILQIRERHIALLDAEIRQKNDWIKREQTERDRMLEKVRAMEAELEEHNRWARQANEEAERRAQVVVQLQEELRQSNEWAQARDAEAFERGRRIEQLQAEVAAATAWAQSETARLEKELDASNEWARARDREIVEIRSGYEAAIEQWRLDKEASDRWAIETERRLSAERDAAREAFAAKSIDFENALQRITSLEAKRDRLTAQLSETTQQLAMIAQSRWLRLGRVVRVGPQIKPTHS
jgi:SAM-dependent methyltransferase